MSDKYFVPIDQWGQNNLANNLWGKEWEFGESVPDLSIGKQEGHLWVLSKAYVEGVSLP